jgi:hypothetical protein
VKYQVVEFSVIGVGSIMLITAYSDVSGMAPLLRFYKQYEQKYKKNSVKITRIFVSVERIALYFSLIIRFEEARNSKA